MAATITDCFFRAAHIYGADTCSAYAKSCLQCIQSAACSTPKGVVKAVWPKYWVI